MRRLLSLIALITLAAVAGAGPAQAAPASFEVGIHDPLEFPEQDPEGALDAVRTSGARFVRLPVAWSNAAPSRPEHPKDPDDPAYRWGAIDARLDAVRAAGMVPIFTLYSAPRWAGPGRDKARVGDFGAFAAAVARRYSGGPQPRVRYWEQFNEPNLRAFLDETPQHYRRMVNAAYKAIHAVHGDNVVIAGALAPFSNPNDRTAIGPFRYMRAMLCMSRGTRPHPTCKAKASFDVWSHHPYTSGGPNHSARLADDAALGDLPEMRRLLRAAQRAGHIEARGRVRFWVTEFGWDTRGPDPGGVPLKRHARWVAEAMYRMWQSDVSLMVWFQLRDVVPAGDNWGGTFQQGIYFNTTPLYRDERVKPVARVLRFPFVALPEGRGVSIWGRTPRMRGGAVAIERRKSARWLRVRTVHANAHGLFRRRLSGPRGASFRARSGSATSYPFKATRTRDRRVNPFGG